MCHHERKPLLFSLVLNLHIKSRELPTFSNTLSPPKGTSSGSPWNFAPNIGLPTPVLKFQEIWEQDLERTEFGEEKKLSKEGDAIESTIQSCCFFPEELISIVWKSAIILGEILASTQRFITVPFIGMVHQKPYQKSPSVH